MGNAQPTRRYANFFAASFSMILIAASFLATYIISRYTTLSPNGASLIEIVKFLIPTILAVGINGVVEIGRGKEGFLVEAFRRGNSWFGYSVFLLALSAIPIFYLGIKQIKIAEIRSQVEFALPSFESEWMTGGHSPKDICAPKEAFYAAKYPGYQIQVSTTEASRKDFWGYVSYRYNCQFQAVRKP